MQNVNLLNMTTAEKLVALAKAVNDIYDTPIFPNPRGVWVSNESYNKYDIVVYNNKTYWSIYDGAQSGQQPDTSPNYWVIYIDPVNGKNGTNGTDGTDGDDGKAATITVGTTETVESDQPAEVTNVGSENAAVLNFKIPKGKAAHGYTHIINFDNTGHVGRSVSFRGQLVFSNDNPEPYTSLDDIGEALYELSYRQELSRSPICYGTAVSSLSDGNPKTLVVTGCYGLANNSGIWLNMTYPNFEIVTFSDATKTNGQLIEDFVIDGNITLGSSTPISLKVYHHTVSFLKPYSSGNTNEKYIQASFYTFNEYGSPMSITELATYLEQYGSSDGITACGASIPTANTSTIKIYTCIRSVDGETVDGKYYQEHYDTGYDDLTSLYEGDSVTTVLSL